MTDEHTHSDGTRQPGRYDDDRLLACALGLEEDPDLLAAAEADAELAARLAAVRDDVDAVGAQVRAAVPAPDDSYTDLSSGRWSGLSEFFRAPAERRRRRRWVRVLAPVAAVLVLAVVVGVVAMDLSGQIATSGSGVDAGRTADEAAPSKSQDLGFGGAGEAAPQTTAERLAEQLDHFAVVVLARARAATGALQRFAVVRILKGDAPEVVELQVADEPADAGKLHLLMLDPVETARGEDLSPEPIPSLATTRGDLRYGTALAVSYLYNGEPTMVREFEEGTDPDTVDLPLP